MLIVDQHQQRSLPEQTTRLPLRVARFFLTLMSAAILSATALIATTAYAQTGQTITINSNVSGPVYGNSSNLNGSLRDLAPENNTLTVNATFTVTGLAYGSSTPSATPNASVTNNSLVIHGTVTSNAFGGQGGGLSTGHVADNTVEIATGGTVNANVYGGNGSYSGNIEGNKVIIRGTANTIVHGGYGGSSATGAITNNTVEIIGGTVGSPVGTVYGGFSHNASNLPTNNHVIIEGGTVGTASGSVYAANRGHSNTVTVKNSATPATIFTRISGCEDTTTSNNTLEIHGRVNTPIVQRFQYVNFHLPSTIAHGNILINTTGTAAQTSLTGVTISLDFAEAPTVPLSVGNKITLFNRSAGTPANNGGTLPFTLTADGYTFEIKRETNALTAEVTAIPVPPAITVTPPDMTTTEGYTATSSGAFTVTGIPTPTVSLTGDAAFTWNTTTQEIDIAAGLATGAYQVTVTAANGVLPNATHTFTFTVDALTYTVTINDSQAGAGSGEGNYVAGDTVAIDAGTRSGYTFAGWTTTSAGVVFADASSATTTFTMPAGTVNITANWTPAAAPTPVNIPTLNPASLVLLVLVLLALGGIRKRRLG